MRKARAIAGFILSLMIVSQFVLAVSAPCSIMASSSELVVAEVEAGTHAGHHMEAGESGDSCCEGGYCSLSGCLALSAVHNDRFSIPVNPPGQSASVVAHASPSKFLETLYRPPIVT